MKDGSIKVTLFVPPTDEGGTDAVVHMLMQGNLKIGTLEFLDGDYSKIDYGLEYRNGVYVRKPKQQILNLKAKEIEEDSE